MQLLILLILILVIFLGSFGYMTVQYQLERQALKDEVLP
ncbi:hypothetical protein Krac_10228 [Ktedonobacter racemifer DSM 44963]|uniref:Uncharacterized protein n=1 Tax=Ktedonobacter racemifer DSM 44963 TaxID=485913 RepID=D6TG32_KTERA|nr:hypothetical protein Krac_10228 [Ktedonobacter racemifer DSM 44963]